MTSMMNADKGGAVDDAAGSMIRPKLAFVTAIVGGQRIGLPIADVRDVLDRQNIQSIPLAPKAVAGALNLRGKVITALDLRICLGLEPCPDPSAAMGVVVSHNGALYNLLVDEIGDVASPSPDSFERPPTTLSMAWRNACPAIYKQDDALLLTLDIARLLSSVNGSLETQ